MDDTPPIQGAWRPVEPVAQQLEKLKTDAQVVKALPLIQDILDRFNEKVEFFKSVESIPEDVLTLPDEFMHIVAANKLVASMLQAELNYLEDLVAEHAED